MGQSKSKSIEELAKLLSGVAAMQEKITMTEALGRDLMIVLYGKNGLKHQCVEYDDEKLIGFSRDILRGCYDIRAEVEQLRKENAELKAEVERLKESRVVAQFPVHISWWEILFRRKKVARKLHKSDGK